MKPYDNGEARRNRRTLDCARPQRELDLLGNMQAPPAISQVVITDELLGFHLEDGRFISVPIGFYPTLALATPEERSRFEINGSSVFWPDLDADIGVEGLLAGAREHPYYARQAVERAVRQGRLSRTALEETRSEEHTSELQSP